VGNDEPRHVAGTQGRQLNWQELIWSPDSRFVAYQVYEEGSENLYLVDVTEDALVPRRVETNGSLDGSNAFAWHANWRLLYQLGSSATPGGLWLTDVQADDAPVPVYDGWRNWSLSPDRLRLAHHGPFFGPAPPSLHVQSLAGSVPAAPVPITVAGSDVDSFVWSPSSDILLVTTLSNVQEGAQRHRIAAVNVSETLPPGATLVSEGTQAIEQLRWSPGSYWVSVRVGYSAEARFRLCHVPTRTGHEFHSASPAPSYTYFGAWSPDGNAFVVADIGDKPALILRFVEHVDGALSEPLVASGVLPHAETTIGWQP